MWAEYSYIGKKSNQNKFLEKEIQGTDTLLQSSNQDVMVVLWCLSGEGVTECGGRLASKDITKCTIGCFEDYTMSRTDFKDYGVQNGLLI